MKNEVTQFIADKIGVPISTINPKQRISELVQDDFDLVDIMMDLESEFDIVLSEDVEFEDVADIICSVEDACKASNRTSA